MPHFINGQWLNGNGTAFHSENPVDGSIVWTGNTGTADEASSAIVSASQAFESWAGKSVLQRVQVIESFALELKKIETDIAKAISIETGKPTWEAKEEVATVIAKAAVSIVAMQERRKEIATESAGVASILRYKPHGVVVVLGPFNFPIHLPHGHIIPALLAGNTVVFKPSELTPMVAELTVRAWQSAGLPAGVLNLVQGDRQTATHLISHDLTAGVFFTGSVQGGLAISKSLADQPWKILALEMGGNNPLIVADVEPSQIASAVDMTILSAFVTAGQRCTCARRLIVPVGSDGDAILQQLILRMQKIRVGKFDDVPEPFMGPVISSRAGEAMLAAQDELLRAGGKSLVMMQALNSRHTMLCPGLIDVTSVANRKDVELFGPVLQVIRTKDFDAAIAEANNTRFGLAAALFSSRHALYDTFLNRIRAGVVNFNRPTTGASGKLPFGGIGQSGNHRPSGYFATDYCSYPIASMESLAISPPAIKGMNS